ncbi:DUF5007 domain-containing protein [Pedobacter punctiformis]|uniref:DUF5007 domain-containing protein n=1 Tax=Pedobacter punctiformis TaxID=3004097 RepID=A0ABT4LAB7_9SPHI|nr:DUF5007 domain-containing protein [Pedobacter sp. HCMS5-2]MCZ4244858.1 DUF5007 domain-containing protein [Pedobacter sp. HCMS5-2]
MDNKRYLSLFGVLLFGFAFAITACKKNLPDARLSLGSDSQFTTTVYKPVLGRNTLFSNNFNAASSSLPLSFKIINMRRFNGDPAPELTENFPVTVWKQSYLGDEKSLAEIEAKRTTENHPLFEIREHSGQFLMWAKAKSDFVRAQPDSGYVFDVEMTNSGGRRYFKNFKLQPYKERPYELSAADPITGQISSGYIFPGIFNNIRGERTNRYLSPVEVQVLTRKVNDTGNSLTFKFVDSLYNPIDPNKFAATQWPTVVHGFDMVKTNEAVSYKVAYPVPLAAYPTIYTDGSGQAARAVFRYDRQGFGNVKESAQLGLYFQLFEKGDWEITFWFRTERPKFTND